MIDDLLGIQNIGVVSILDFLVGIFELILLSLSFKFIYDRYSTSVSNRHVFSFFFLPFSVSIFLIVVTIKSSLVLSLGLVGALSIIRFRTAIKETEQIVSLLYLTGISISIAANQLILPIITSIIIFLFYLIRYQKMSKINNTENVIVSEILNFKESAFKEIIDEISNEKMINISLVSLNQKDDKINIILTFSELDLNLIENYKSKIKLKKMKLVELKVY
jgi:hypothetical protein|tara:strand:+ start:91 stop:750 length:660 start_codon:yes stop_codon:yes gene_type:complete